MLQSGDVFSVTADGLTATTPAVGNLVELQADTTLNIVATATSGSTQVGKIIAKEVVGNYTFYAIQVA